MGTTLSRNQPGIQNKIRAQFGYALATLVAIVESVAALSFLACSALLWPFTPDLFEHSCVWLKSSSFSIAWSACDFLLNPVAVWLVADEKSARLIASTGRLLSIPRDAFL